MNELALQQSLGGRLRELALFAGAGGGILGGYLLGWQCVCAVELDAYAAGVLLARQNDGCLPPFPVWDDICTFDGVPWRGCVDVVSGGFPCTDISIAGKGAGIDGDESGLWREQARIIGEVRPDFAWIENSPALTFRGGVRVIADLVAMGYDCQWGIISAADAIWTAGTPCIDHLRDRIWIAASRSDAESLGRRARIVPIGTSEAQSEPGIRRATGSDSTGIQQREQRKFTRTDPAGFGRETGNGQASRTSEREAAWNTSGADTSRVHEQGIVASGIDEKHRQDSGERSPGPQNPSIGWWSAEPDVGRVAPRVSARSHRLKCLGMAQVPAVVRLAWETLTNIRTH